jgi:small subunit ribosomal protein S16
MLVIRLQKTGKKNSPSFRVVVTEKSTGPRGRAVEVLGFHNPRLKTTEFKAERVHFWLNKGAQVSDTVHNLLVNNKIIEGEKIAVHKVKKIKDQEEATATADQAAIPEGEVKPAEAPTEAVVEPQQKEEKPKPIEENTNETEPQPEAKKKEKPVKVEEQKSPEKEKSESETS